MVLMDGPINSSDTRSSHRLQAPHRLTSMVCPWFLQVRSDGEAAGSFSEEAKVSHDEYQR